jgi:hypothetical protein
MTGSAPPAPETFYRLTVTEQEKPMTAKIGSKHIAQHRGKKEREEIHKMNVAREALKIEAARAKYRNQQKGQRPQAAAAA